MRKRLKRIAPVFLLLGAALALVPLILSQRNQRAPARYREDLLAKGEELEVSELLPDYAPGDATNAALLIERLAALPAERVFSNGFPMLLEYFGPGKARVFIARAELCHNGKTNTWTDLDNALGRAAPVLDTIESILRHHADYDFQFPYGPYPYRTPGPLTNYFEAAVWYKASAMSHLRHGERTAAVRQIENLRRLADTLKAERYPIIQLARIDVAHAGLEATWEALQAQGWTEPELAELQTIWEPSGYAVGMLRALEMRRVMDLATLQSLRKADPTVSKDFFGHEASSSGKPSTRFQAQVDDYLSSNAVAPFWNAALGEGAESHFLWHSQHLIDGIRLAVSQRSALALRDASSEYRQWRQSAGNLGLMRFMFTAMCLPGLTRDQEKAMHVETEREMAVAEIALRRYALRHGRLAGRLDELVPEFLAQVPVDFMDGQPLRYRLETGGTWVLYSVGEDGNDDKGNAEPKEKMEERMEFLSADLWSAHDAVWPKPASVEEVARFDAEEEAWRAQTRQRLEEIKRAKTNAAPNSRTAGGSTSSPARPQSTLTNPP